MISGSNTEKIKRKAVELGFAACGVARAEELTDDAFRLEQWLKKERHGKMSYMANHFDKRIDPTKLVEGARSVLTFSMNYFAEQKTQASRYRVSQYAYGQDYHAVIRAKLRELLVFIRDEIGDVQGRGFVDSAPVLERAWAAKSGLGWVGKNGNLISKKEGSFFFLATLIIDLELEPDAPFATDHCGTCRRCVDACPTEAILPNREINGAQCISYFTIELKDALLQPEKPWADWVFGCDICQEVCPWNRFAVPHQQESFHPKPELMKWTDRDWEEITEELFREVFHDSPLRRTGFDRLVRNIRFAGHGEQDHE